MEEKNERRNEIEVEIFINVIIAYVGLPRAHERRQGANDPGAHAVLGAN